jgi:glycosyltransferase involved in cell wall biosynthesis
MRAYPSVSAVIPAYNAERFISDTIQSVLAQTYELTEIIVVDDGSCDDTSVVAAKFPKTRVIRRQNGGQAAARNAGIHAAAGEWIAFLDHDDQWLPQKTETQLGSVAPDVGVIHANRFDRVHFGSLWHRQAHITPSGAMVRKRTLLEVGGFDESRALQGVEDLNLWLRIALTDWRFVKSGTGLFEWRETGQNQSANDWRMAQAELVNIDMLGKGADCQAEEVERVKQRARIEYAKNLIATKQWDEAALLLQECFPSLSYRYLALAGALKMNRLARPKVVRALQSVDEGFKSHECSGKCTLSNIQRRQCMASCHNPYCRPAEAR